MPSLTPKEPIKASHRYIHKTLSMAAKGDVEYRVSEFDRVARVFCQVGGSWERLFKGSAKDNNLLIKVVKTAVKSGHITKKGKW